MTRMHSDPSLSPASQATSFLPNATIVAAPLFPPLSLMRRMPLIIYIYTYIYMPHSYCVIKKNCARSQCLSPAHRYTELFTVGPPLCSDHAPNSDLPRHRSSGTAARKKDGTRAKGPARLVFCSKLYVPAASLRLNSNSISNRLLGVVGRSERCLSMRTQASG